MEALTGSLQSSVKVNEETVALLKQQLVVKESELEKGRLVVIIFFQSFQFFLFAVAIRKETIQKDYSQQEEELNSTKAKLAEKEELLKGLFERLFFC